MKKNINIIWLHTHFLYWMGGTKFIHQVIKELKKKNNIKNITVIVENTSDFANKQFKELSIELISLNSKTSTSVIYWALLPFFLINNYFKIKSILKSKKLNKKNSIIISSMFPMNFIANLFELKHVQNCYEPFAFFYDRNFISQFPLLKKTFITILSFFYSPLDKWSTKKSTVLLTLNNTTKKMIKNIYDVDCIKTQAGVNSDLFKPYVSIKIKNKYKNQKIAIHSTDYSPVKGTDLVIKAFAVASKKIPNARLLITTTIDDSQRKSELIKLAKNLKVKNKIDFLGFLPIEELPQYYSLANVMIQGAYSESSGTTSMSLPIKEAMCCETPAIRPDIGGEDVIDGKSGFLVDPRKTLLLAEKMKILLKNDKLSKKMGKVGREYIKNKYTWENTAKIFEKSCY